MRSAYTRRRWIHASKERLAFMNKFSADYFRLFCQKNDNSRTQYLFLLFWWVRQRHRFVARSGNKLFLRNWLKRRQLGCFCVMSHSLAVWIFNFSIFFYNSTTLYQRFLIYQRHCRSQSTWWFILLAPAIVQSHNDAIAIAMIAARTRAEPVYRNIVKFMSYCS